MGCFCEVSQSGNGYHIIGRGDIGEHKCKNQQYGIELYTEKRIITMTGKETTGNPDKQCNIAPAVYKYFSKGDSLISNALAKGGDFCGSMGLQSP